MNYDDMDKFISFMVKAAGPSSRVNERMIRAVFAGMLVTMPYEEVIDIFKENGLARTDNLIDLFRKTEKTLLHSDKLYGTKPRPTPIVPYVSESTPSFKGVDLASLYADVKKGMEYNLPKPSTKPATRKKPKPAMPKSSITASEANAFLRSLPES